MMELAFRARIPLLNKSTTRNPHLHLKGKSRSRLARLNHHPSSDHPGGAIRQFLPGPPHDPASLDGQEEYRAGREQQRRANHNRQDACGTLIDSEHLHSLLIVASQSIASSCRKDELHQLKLELLPQTLPALAPSGAGPAVRKCISVRAAGRMNIQVLNPGVGGRSYYRITSLHRTEPGRLARVNRWALEAAPDANPDKPAIA